MNILVKLAPHAAILIGNMYYVFWGIDRVNKSMNFIDNPYTKFLLLILIACCGLTDWRLTRISLAKLRRTDNPVPVYVRLGVIALNALLAAVILILLVIDLFGEDLLLFLNEFVKVMILILSITGLLNSLQFTARERAVIRMENRRRAQMRRPAPQQSAPQRRPNPQYAQRPPQQPRYSNGYRSQSSAPARAPQRPAGYDNRRPSTRIPEQDLRRPRSRFD